jgi:hypothetical protein
MGQVFASLGWKLRTQNGINFGILPAEYGILRTENCLTVSDPASYFFLSTPVSWRFKNEQEKKCPVFVHSCLSEDSKTNRKFSGTEFFRFQLYVTKPNFLRELHIYGNEFLCSHCTWGEDLVSMYGHMVVSVIWSGKTTFWVRNSNSERTGAHRFGMLECTSIIMLSMINAWC